MAEPTIERCRVCDSPTGRAGRHDDSMYCEVCGLGPLCEGCVSERDDGVRCQAEHGEDDA